MIFVSSCRPLVKCDAAYAKNQIDAWKSWQRVAQAVTYFNHPQPELASPITRFIPSEPFPRLIDLVELCADQDDWCAILNADIIITPRFLTVEAALKGRKAWCASSWRHEFDPARGIEPRERVDNGLDFFAARPEFWAKVYNDVPTTLRIGAQRWDTWMLSYFSVYGLSGFWDITPSRCVAHPKHGGREYGDGGPEPHFPGWPTMSSCTIA